MNDSNFNSNEEIYFDDVYISTSPYVDNIGNSYATSDLWLNPGFEKGTGGSFGDSGFCISNWTQWGQSGSQHSDFNHTPGGQRAVKIWNGDSGLYQYIAISNSFDGICKFSGFARSPSDDALNGWTGKMEVQWLSNSRDVGHCNVGYFFGNEVDSYNSWNMSRELVKPAAANGVKSICAWMIMAIRTKADL